MASNNGSVDQEQEELLDASSPNKQQNFGSLFFQIEHQYKMFNNTSGEKAMECKTT